MNYEKNPNVDETVASKLLLGKKDNSRFVSEWNRNKPMLERVIIVTEINKCFIIDFYRIIKLILLIDLFSL